MKLSGAITSCCVALLLVFTCTSALQKVKTIDDLKRLKFGQSVPSHSLLLLYWFANTIDIDNNNVMRLTFDPIQGDYGSHHYGNYEGMLEPLPQGNIRYRYYTVGNLNQEMSSELPSYIVHPRFGYEGRNRDRIVFRVREQSVGRQPGQLIDRVYITQHFETSDNQGTRYDQAHTYQITVNLLRQIREFSEEENDMNSLINLRDRFGSNADGAQLRYIRNSWGSLACLGLFLFIVIQEKNSSDPHKNRQQSTRGNTHSNVVVNIPESRRITHSNVVVNIPESRRNTRSNVVVNMPESRRNTSSGMFVSISQDERDEVTLRVTTTPGGKARILWNNVPKSLTNKGVMVVLCKDDHCEEKLTYKSIGNKESGSYDTSVPLNEGLQVRLYTVQKCCFFWTHIGEELHRGAEFKNPPSVNIKGYNANLQLFAKDGKACARLYVKTSFNDWRPKFKKSWVGFYSSEDKATKNYEWFQWQWVTKFEPNTMFYNLSGYVVYEYHSGMTIAPGVQARFILHDEVERARTPSWTE